MAWSHTRRDRPRRISNKNHDLDGVSERMKQAGRMNRFLSIVLLAAMVLSLLPGQALATGEQYGYLVINNSSKNRVVNFRRLPNTNDNTNYPIAQIPEFWVV